MGPSRKVIILGGFLGSGKTTYLNHLIRTLGPGKRVALVVNEFGSIPIDGKLVEHEGYQVREIFGGCVCCTLKDRLNEGLERIIKEQDPQLIYIEATGLAIPAEMKSNIERGLSHLALEIASPIVLVDARQYLRFSGNLRAYDNQFSEGITIEMTKQDIYEKELIEQVRSLISERYVRKSLEGLFTLSPGDGRDEVVSISLSGETHPQLGERYILSLIEQHRDLIIRAKGLICSDSCTQVIQFDGNEISTSSLEPDPTHRSCLIIFCRKTDRQKLSQTF